MFTYPGEPDERRVIVENQLGRSDHDHLGKLVTYVTGIARADVGVWVAERFAQPHIEAVKKLNDSGLARFCCFSFRGTSSGYSLVKPVIELKRATREAGYRWPDADLGFWNEFVETLDVGSLQDIQMCKKSEQPGTWINLVHSDIKLKGVSRRRRPDRALFVELLLRGDRARHLVSLEKRDTELRGRLGDNLEYCADWDEPTVRIRRDYNDLSDPGERPAHFEWLATNLAAFMATLEPIMSELEAGAG